MKIPTTLNLLELEEDEALIKLSDLTAAELLELQTLADKITELVLIVHLSREYMVGESDESNM
jgi:hypothetical protein